MSHWVERNGGHLIVLLLSVILNGTLVLILRWPAQPALQITAPTPSPTPGRVRVYVSGAVIAPAVYELPLGSLVKDAVAAAGGGATDADLSAINLALEAKDQSQINVPSRLQAAQPVQISPISPGVQTGLVNLNAAGVAELETLPGIGPALAQRIVDYRNQSGPFASIEALKEVEGIGAVTFDRLKDHVAVQ